MSKTVKVTVKLPEDLVKRAKHEAIDRASTLTRLIERGLQHELRTRK